MNSYTIPADVSAYLEEQELIQLLYDALETL